MSDQEQIDRASMAYLRRSDHTSCLDWVDYSERLAWQCSIFYRDELWNRVSSKLINKN